MSQLFRLKNGTVLLTTEAPGGIYNSSQLKKIAELCSKELAIVKATEDQRLALFVKESEVEQIAEQLRAMGLGFRHYQDSLHQPVSCLGELCEEHEQPAMATALDITKEIASIQLNAPLKIGINGCARCCTPCHTLDISVVGDASGYRISLGGKTNQMPEFASYFAEAVPPKELPRLIKAVIESYQSLAEPGETLHDVIERCGVSDFVQALAPYSQDAAPREDPFAGDSLPVASAPMEQDDADSDLDLAMLDEEEVSKDDEDLQSIDDGLEEVSDDVGLLDELDSSDLDADPITLDDDKPGHLEEIPIDQGHQGSLDEDLSMDDLALDAPQQDDDLGEDTLLEFEEPSPAATAPVAKVTADEDLLLNDDQADDLSLELGEDDLAAAEESISMDDVESLELAVQTEEELDLVSADEDAALLSESADVEELSAEDDDLMLDLDVEPEVITADDITEDLTLDDVAEELSLDEASEDPDLQVTSDVSEDELSFDESDLEDPKAIEQDDSEIGSLDEDELLDSELSSDDDLESIPELDEDLAPEELTEQPLQQSAVAVNLQENFDEDLTLDVADLSDEEESQFEQKLQASIDEESRMIATSDRDHNMGDRQAAIKLMERHAEQEPSELDFSESSDDEDMEPIADSMEEFAEPQPNEVAQIKARQLGQKSGDKGQSQEFKLSGIRFKGDLMRVNFVSGAYVDFDLSALEPGEVRSFQLGEQNFSVTSSGAGYMLEVDGMRLFHPKTPLSAAS